MPDNKIQIKITTVVIIRDLGGAKIISKYYKIWIISKFTELNSEINYPKFRIYEFLDIQQAPLVIIYKFESKSFIVELIFNKYETKKIITSMIHIFEYSNTFGDYKI